MNYKTCINPNKKPRQRTQDSMELVLGNRQNMAKAMSGNEFYSITLYRTQCASKTRFKKSRYPNDLAKTSISPYQFLPEALCFHVICINSIRNQVLQHPGWELLMWLWRPRPSPGCLWTTACRSCYKAGQVFRYSLWWCQSCFPFHHKRQYLEGNWTLCVLSVRL